MGARGPSAFGRLGRLAALTLALSLTATLGQTESEPGSSVIAPLAHRSLLLDAARAGQRLVAVGERGHVLLSDDDGAGWRQVGVPSRATLTAVFFVDAQLGFAVGHDATILRTRDAGESWERVYHAPEEQRPLLDLWFRDADRGVAVGAYGFYLVTEDGGESWVPRDVLPEDEEVDEFYGGGIDYHLNQIRHAGDGRLFLAAEAGTVLRSLDYGETWELLPSPYAGSFFGTLPLDGTAVLLFGLRGHIFRSEDDGAHWEQVQSGTVSMLTDALRLPDGKIVVVGLAGTLLTSNDDGRSFTLRNRADRMGISTVLESADGRLLLFGDAGAIRAGASEE